MDKDKPTLEDWLDPDFLRSKRMDRRRFLQEAGRITALSLGFTLSGALLKNVPVEAAPRFPSYPFTLGVASGDPMPDSVVLWTRLAPDPLNGGGMPPRDIPVRWEVAADEGFRRVIQSGTAYARSDFAHSVHVEVSGLQPDHHYYYRFKAGSELSPVGRTKTLPAPNAAVPVLSFAFASCQHYEHGYYTAYRRMAEEDLDLVLHLGDYIYEHGTGEYLCPSGNVRSHNSRKPRTLEEYRNRHALYKTDPDLQKAHAAFPWVVVWDDHEVENNYAGTIPQGEEGRRDFIRRRMAAYRAYYEHMPLRSRFMPRRGEMRLYRRFRCGDLVNFHVLDTRQYRDNQAGGDGWKPPGRESADPNRTLLGAEQERWLLSGLENSKARWNVIAQQVFFSKKDVRVGPGELLNMDSWDGYPASRDRILKFIAEKGISNLVVLTGDVHSNWANEIKADFDRPDSPTVGVEFVGTSITSDGDGFDTRRDIMGILAENPHIKFFNGQRGYVRCTVTPDIWRTDYRVLPYVSRPGAPITTRATFVVESGRPGLRRTKGESSLVTTG
ncbi:alkaline phosphatase D [Planifilum fulgidum]|jgi:alkaline phosphatase D|uniref:Alkaline phosphatase D n=1 Tax=Planifilum fulgidum TaxID=201973 RepID=A0A1I2MMB7_9BACL|nr:alkaline phosphatase D [Planifilum fulgidum]